MHLLITALAVLWAWEYLLILCPVRIPAWLQPALVAGCAIGATHVPGWVINAAAVAALVALGHKLLSSTSDVVVHRTGRRIPPLR